MERISQTDALTGLPNRGLIDLHFAREVERAQRYGRDFSIIMLDINRFKKVNDDLGHLVGYHVLVEVAQRVRIAVRAGDVASRWGARSF